MKKFGLSKTERIKSKKRLDLLFTKGSFVLSKNGKVKAVFCFENSNEQSGVKAAFTVSKKAGTAVWRNRIKRLFKESFRLNKESLINVCVQKQGILFVVFMLNRVNQKNFKKPALKDFIDEIIDLISKISVRLKNSGNCNDS
ncbi:MAG: ribonuclease P protein component [bacterium]